MRADKINAGGMWDWTSIPSRLSRTTPRSFMLRKLGKGKALAWWATWLLYTEKNAQLP